MRLILFHPVKYQFITQQFGEANAWRLPNGKVVGGRVKPQQDAVNFYTHYLGHKGHNGLDIAASRGAQVYAAHPGVVSEISTDPSKGLEVHLRTEGPVETSAHSGFHKTIYLHLQGINVKPQDKVKVGDLLGWADNTGNSGGDHLHFGLAPCDEKGIKLFPDNGYGGYTDPNPYMAPISALDARSKIVKILEAFAVWNEKLADIARSFK